MPYVRIADRKPTKDPRLLEIRQRINNPEELQRMIEELATKMANEVVKNEDNKRRVKLIK